MNSIEPRKIIKFGNSSYVISLPISWIKENNLNKGDLVYLQKNSSNEITILPTQNNNHQEKERKLLINLDGKDFDTYRREINSAYINGYDLIMLKGKTLKPKIRQIKRVVEFLTGLSIINHGNEGVLLKDILSYDKLPPKELVSRINIILNTMFNHLKDALKTKKFNKGYNEIKTLDIEINKNYILIWKLMKKHNLNTNHNQEYIYNLWWLAMNQEYIGDELKRFARGLTKVNFSNKEYRLLLKITEEAEKSYKEAILALDKKDIKLALNLAKKPLIKTYQKILGGNKNIILDNLCDRFKTISRHIHYIIKIAIY
ncbi:hypothetical protein B6U80_00525 [Candidatus Pacearchaeota archaeon ex4484_26]|nr:MAG: hypothetical protein B6U80_00525 [Candidatus Pacearchaeota archaeon ex4484_26]